jgi:hypothetical protein
MQPTKKLKCKTCPKLLYADNQTGQCRACFNLTRHNAIPGVQLSADRDRQRAIAELATLRKKYDESLKTIDRQERELKVVGGLRNNLETFDIQALEGGGTSEGTAVLVASDWHVEENVNPHVISGLNEYNLDIAQARATKFFQAGLRLVRLLQQDLKIPRLVLPLLGDFISNDIHAEVAEVAEVSPIHAIVHAQKFLASGIEFLLDHSDLSFVIPCHSGNHARTTEKTRFATENGHSLEYLMYLHLAAYFRSEPRVQFLIAEGMHSYVNVYDKMIRFHHGHAVKYQGGVGGIYIPVNKAIAQWNKARHADLDVFGHFHQLRDGGNFICNGSLIGYNAFALSIKADYEQPKQALFLIDKKRGGHAHGQ